MARKRTPRTEDEGEETRAESQGDTEDRTRWVKEDEQKLPMPELVEQSPQNPAPEPARAEPAPDVPIKKYRVTMPGNYLHRGMLCRLSVGKVLREVDYDIAKVRGSGIGLEEVKE